MFSWCGWGLRFLRAVGKCDPYLMYLAQKNLQYVDVTSGTHQLVTLYRPSNKALARDTRYTAICTQAKLYRGCPALGAQYSTSFPGSFILPPPGALVPVGGGGGGLRRKTLGTRLPSTTQINPVTSHHLLLLVVFTNILHWAFFCNELKKYIF